MSNSVVSSFLKLEFFFSVNRLLWQLRLPIIKSSLEYHAEGFWYDYTLSGKSAKWSSTTTSLGYHHSVAFSIWFWYLVYGISYLVSGTWYLIPGDF
jgi:hypothetical protein